MSYAKEFDAISKMIRKDAWHGNGPEVRFVKVATFAIQVNYTDLQWHTYDFLNRIMITKISTSTNDAANIAMTTTPFKELDRDVLETLHAKLVDLGGLPPELPPIEADPPPNKPPRGTAPAV